jgi:hypothetical protein
MAHFRCNSSTLASSSKSSRSYLRSEPIALSKVTGIPDWQGCPAFTYKSRALMSPCPSVGRFAARDYSSFSRGQPAFASPRLDTVLCAPTQHYHSVCTTQAPSRMSRKYLCGTQVASLSTWQPERPQTKQLGATCQARSRVRSTRSRTNAALRSRVPIATHAGISRRLL